MRNGRLEKVLRSHRAREPAELCPASPVPCPVSHPNPPTFQSRKGSAVQDFDCCSVRHFALVCEKEMSGFFFFLFYFYSYKCSSPAAFPVLREAVPRVSQQGRCSPFAPLPARSAPDRFLGKSWSLSVLAQEVPGPVVSA